MTSSLTRQQKTPCVSCSHPLEPLAKFCGECGTTVESLSYHNSSIPLESAFAQVAKRMGIEPGSVQAQTGTGPFPAQNVTGGFPAQNVTGGFPAQNVTGGFPAQNVTGNVPAQNGTVSGAPQYSNQVSIPYNAAQAAAGSYAVPAQQQAMTNSHTAMPGQQQAVTNSYNAMSAQQQAVTNSYNAMSAQQQAVTNSYNAMSAQRQAVTNSYNAMSPQPQFNAMPAEQQKMTGSFNGIVSAQGGQQVQQHAPNGVPSGFVLDKHNNPQYAQQSLSQPLPQQVVIPNTVSYDDLAKLEAYRLSQISGTQMNWAPTPSANPRGNTVPLPPTGGAPTFARLNAGTKGGVSPALVSEMESLNASLIRERVFLIMHCAIFLVTNLVGFYLAMTCYYGIHGDEVTKFVMALTPLTFINFVGLSCLAPIKGTRREIARLLEKKQYVQFQMEYSNLMR